MHFSNKNKIIIHTGFSSNDKELSKSINNTNNTNVPITRSLN